MPSNPEGHGHCEKSSTVVTKEQILTGFHHSIPNGFHSSNSSTTDSSEDIDEHPDSFSQSNLNDQYITSSPIVSGDCLYVSELDCYCKNFIKGFWDPLSCKFAHPSCMKLLNLHQSLESALLYGPSVTLHLNPSSSISLEQAILSGQVHLDNGNLIVSNSNLQYSLASAFKERIICLEHPEIKELDFVQFRKKIGPGLFDLIKTGSVTAATRILDVKNQEFVNLATANDRHLFDIQTGQIQNSSLKKWLDWNEALNKGFIADKIETSIADLVHEGNFDSANDLFRESTTGKWFTLDEMISFQHLSLCSEEVLNTKSNQILTIREAFCENILHSNTAGCFYLDLNKNRQLTIIEAVNKEFLISRKLKILLHDQPQHNKKPQYNASDVILNSNFTTDNIQLNSDKITSPSLRRRSSMPTLSSKRRTSVSTLRRESLSLCTPLLAENAGDSVTLDEAILTGLYNPLKNTVTYPSDECVPLSVAIDDGFIRMESLVRDPVSWDVMILSEAISKRLIDVDSGKMMDAQSQAIALNFALEKGLIVRCQSPLKLSLTEMFDELYNEDTNLFLNPNTNEEISFSDAVNIGLIDTGLIRVRNDAGEACTFSSALENNLFNAERSELLYHGTRYSLIEAIDKGLILDISSQPGLTLQEAFEEGIYDPCKKRFVDPFSSLPSSFMNALEFGLLDKNSITVRDVNSQTLLTVSGGILQGIISASDGSYITPSKCYTLEEAIRKGLILQDKGTSETTPIEAVKLGIYNPESCKFINPKSGKIENLQEAVSSGLLMVDQITIKHEEHFLTIDEAVQKGILNVENVKINSNGKDLDLKEAVDAGIIRLATDQSAVGLVTAIQSDLFDQDLKNVIDPISGKQIDIQDAIDIGLINPKLTLVKKSSNESFSPLNQAIDQGWFDSVKGTLCNSEGSCIDLSTALSNNLVSDISNNISLNEAIELGFYQEDTNSVFNIHTQAFVPLKEAIESHVISDKDCFMFPDHRSPLSILQAIEANVLDSSGKFISQNRSYTLAEGLKTQKVLPCNNLNGKQVIDSPQLHQNSEMGFLKDPLVWDDHLKCYIPFKTAVKKRILNPENFTLSIPGNQHLSYEEALEVCYIIDAEKPKLSLIAAYDYGVFDPQRQMFWDPRIDDYKNLTDSLSSNLIDGQTSLIKHPENGSVLTLYEALEKGVISSKTMSLLNKSKKTRISLDKAVKSGSIFTIPDQQIDLGKAVKMKLFDPNSSCVLNSLTGKRQTLKEAIDSGFININDTFVSTDNQPLSLSSIIEDNMFDLTTGCLTQSGIRLTLQDAVMKGIIFDHLKPSELSNELEKTKDAFPDVISKGMTLDSVHSVMPNNFPNGLETSQVAPQISFPLSNGISSNFVQSIQDTPTIEQNLSLDDHSLHSPETLQSKPSNVPTSLLNDNLPKCKESLQDANVMSKYPKSTFVESQLKPENLSKGNTVSNAKQTPLESISNSQQALLNPTFTVDVKHSYLANSLPNVQELVQNPLSEGVAVNDGNFIALPKNPVGSQETSQAAMSEGTTFDQSLQQITVPRIGSNEEGSPKLPDSLPRNLESQQSKLSEGIQFNTDLLDTYQKDQEMIQSSNSVSSVSDKADCTTLPNIAPKNQTQIQDSVCKETADITMLGSALGMQEAIHSVASQNTVFNEVPYTSLPVNTLEEQPMLQDSASLRIASDKVEGIGMSGSSRGEQTLQDTTAMKTATKKVESADGSDSMLTDHETVQDTTPTRILCDNEYTEGADTCIRTQEFLTVFKEVIVKDSLSKMQPIKYLKELKTSQDELKQNVFNEGESTTLPCGSLKNQQSLPCTTSIGTDSASLSHNFSRGQRTEKEPISNGILMDGKGPVEPDNEVVVTDDTKTLPEERKNSKSTLILQEMKPELGSLSLIKSSPASDEKLMLTKVPKFIPQNISVSSDASNIQASATEQPLQSPILLYNPELSQLMLPLNLKYSKPETTLNDYLDKGLYEPDTGFLINPDTGNSMTILNALKLELLNPLADEILCPQTLETMNILVANSIGLLSLEKGKFKHPVSNEIMNLYDAKKKGWISKEDKGLKAQNADLSRSTNSDMSADDKTNRYSDLNNSEIENMKLEEAFASGMLSRSNSQVIDPDTVQSITLRRAASLGLIDIKTGIFKNPQTGQCMSLAEALHQGFIISPSGLTLYSAVDQALYDKELGLFCDPCSGKHNDLATVIGNGLITASCMEIRDLHQDSIINLQEAINRGIIDPHKGTYITPGDHKKLDFIEAIAAGLIVSNSTREGLKDSNNADYTETTSSEAEPILSADSNKTLVTPENATKPYLEYNLPQKPLEVVSNSDKDKQPSLNGLSSHTEKNTVEPFETTVPSEQTSDIPHTEEFANSPEFKKPINNGTKETMQLLLSVGLSSTLSPVSSDSLETVVPSDNQSSPDLSVDKPNQISFTDKLHPQPTEPIQLTDPKQTSGNKEPNLLANKMENNVFLREKKDVKPRPNSWNQFWQQSSCKVWFSLEWTC